MGGDEMGCGNFESCIFGVGAARGGEGGEEWLGGRGGQGGEGEANFKFRTKTVAVSLAISN